MSAESKAIVKQNYKPWVQELRIFTCRGVYRKGNSKLHPNEPRIFGIILISHSYLVFPYFCDSLFWKQMNIKSNLKMYMQLLLQEVQV